MDLMDLYFMHHGHVRWRRLGSQVVVLHQMSGVYYTLNELGGVLWEALDGRKRLGSILQEVMESYAVDESTARADFLEIAQDFIDEGLVRTDLNPLVETHRPSMIVD